MTVSKFKRGQNIRVIVATTKPEISSLKNKFSISRGDQGSLGHGVQWDSPDIGNSKKENVIMTSSN